MLKAELLPSFLSRKRLVIIGLFIHDICTCVLCLKKLRCLKSDDNELIDSVNGLIIQLRIELLTIHGY